MALIGIVGGVEIAVLFVSIMIGYIIYAVGREKAQEGRANESKENADIT